MRLTSLWSIAIISLLGGGQTSAGQLNFVVDPDRSSLTFAAIEAPVAVVLSAQQPGSLTASLAGTVVADVTGTTIHALTGTLDPDSRGPFVPNIGGYEANFGYEYTIPLFLSTTEGFFADVAFSLAGGASGQAAEIVAGTNVYTGPLLAIFEQSMAGIQGVNSGAAASIAYAGDLATLTIPANLGLILSLDGQIDVTLRFTGQVVATALVPEPSTAVLVGMAAVCFALWGWRRR